MTSYAYALLGLSLLLALFVGVLLNSLLRLRRVARASGPTLGGEEARASTFVATAMQETVGRLREQEQAMQARAEASERLASEIIASMTSGLLVVRLDGTVRTLNPAALKLLELDEESRDRTFRDMLATTPALVEVIDECLSTGEPIVRRSIEWHPRDDRRPTATSLGVTVSPVFDPDGHASGAICLFTDLTEIVELEARLRLRESLAAVGELTAGIAHEFRNGLATIHGYARLLDPSVMPERLHPCVEGIRDETEALRQVVTNYLNFAKPAELNLAPVDLRAIADRAAEEVRPEVRERGGSVRVLGEFGRVQGDDVLLRQAFSNLCRNALEACVEADEVPSIVLRGTVDTARATARVTVSDNGPGFAADALGRAFEPFFTRKPSGTGLGLALVQKVIVNHDGKVTAGNESHGGGAVQVELPVDRRRGGSG